MHATHFALCALLLSIATSPAHSDEETGNDEADHDALREIRKVAEEAVNKNQLQLLKPYLAEEFTIVTYTDTEFSDFDVFQARWQNTRDELLAGGSYTTDLQPELSQIIGDIAIARGKSNNVLTTGAGEKFEFTSYWTAVLHQRDGQWKVVRAHSSLSPFNNPILESRVKSLLWQVGLGAGAVGLIVGAVSGWLLGRRRPKPAD